MRKMVKMSLAAVMMMGIGSVSAQAEGVDILSNIKAKGEIRARYEMVDADDAANNPNANAFTNRLTVGVSGDMFGTDWLSAYVEMTDVRALNRNYNDGYAGNGAESHDTVVDSEQTRLTQAYVDVKLGKPNLRIGRQMINLDNQRFVGAVGWRQMFQTFDAYTLTCNSIENLSVFASYITQRNTVAYDGKDDGRDLLVNLSYKVMPELKVTAYSYMLGSTHDTYGLALTGDVAVSDGVKVNYRAEYAMQDDASIDNSGGPDDVKADATYYNIELGANISGILAGVRYESLSGANASGSETAFTTPYATLHGQNGWADIFLGTGGAPTNGLEDMSAMLGYTSKDLGTLKVVYHDFQSEVGSTDYGTEVDAVYTRAIPGLNGLVGTLKIADYDADTYSVDTTKFWAMLDYKFSMK